MKFKLPTEAIKGGKKYHLFNPRRDPPQKDEDGNYHYTTVCNRSIWHPKVEYIKDLKDLNKLEKKDICERCLGPLEIL